MELSQKLIVSMMELNNRDRKIRNLLIFVGYVFRNVRNLRSLNCWNRRIKKELRNCAWNCRQVGVLELWNWIKFHNFGE